MLHTFSLTNNYRNLIYENFNRQSFIKFASRIYQICWKKITLVFGLTELRTFCEMEASTKVTFMPCLHFCKKRLVPP